MKKIYIAGSGGMLGEAFYKQFKDSFQLKCTDIDVNESWLSYLDFRNYENYLLDVKDFAPDYLCHLGALTDLEYCELNPEEAIKTNTSSVEHAVKISNLLKTPILYISTAGIFNGKKQFYDDWDKPDPLCTYAKSKYDGEIFVQKNSKTHLICRAGWMMGGGPKKDKKFINKILTQIKNGAEELFIVNDKFGTPTYTHDFAKNVKLLIENECNGLYNMVCDGVTSRLEVTKELLSIIGLSNKINVVEVSSEYFKNEYFAKRPESERLINKRLNSENRNVMRDWKVSLKEYIDMYFSDYL